MMSDYSMTNLAFLDLTLMIMEKTATEEEQKVSLKACQKMILNIVRSEGIQEEFGSRMEWVFEKFSTNLDSL